MTIHDLDSYIESLPDWAMLEGCFGNSTIAPSDIDGWVEINGHSLFLEKKRPNASIRGGQARGFKSLVGQGNTVIAFWADKDKVERMLVLDRDREGGVRAATLQDLRDEVSWWSNRARQQSWLRVAA